MGHTKTAKRLVSRRFVSDYLPMMAAPGITVGLTSGYIAKGKASDLQSRLARTKDPKKRKELKKQIEQNNPVKAGLLNGAVAAGLGAHLTGEYLKGRLGLLKIKKKIGNQFRKRDKYYTHDQFRQYMEAEFSRRAEGYQRQNYSRGRTRNPFANPRIHAEYFGVQNAKTKAEVKKAFRNMARKHHPDAGGSSEKMKEINDRYDQLTNTSWFDKLAFSRGFFDWASKNRLPLTLGVAGSMGAKAYVRKQNGKDAELLDSIASKKEMNAEDLFEEVKKDLPKNTIILTPEKIKKLLNKEKDPIKRAVLDTLVGVTHGNAGAMPARYTELLARALPADVKGKNLIVTSDKVNPSVLLHEAGHVVDFKDMQDRPLARMLRPRYMAESAAWEKAPGEIDTDIRDIALRTYRRGYYPKLGLLGGVTLGMILDGKTRR